MTLARSSRHAAVLLGTGLLLLALAVPAAPDEPPGQLRPGLTQAEARRLLGPPQRVARQLLYRRYLEQWVYDGPQPLRIEFEAIRGQEPRILTVQALHPAQP